MSTNSNIYAIFSEKSQDTVMKKRIKREKSLAEKNRRMKGLIDNV